MNIKKLIDPATPLSTFPITYAMKYTVILSYNDESGATWMDTVDAEDPQEACDEALKQCAEAYLIEVSENGIEPEDEETVEDTILAQAMKYTVIACIKGDHTDVKP